MFGIELGSFFVSSQEPITRARVSIEEYGWTPIGATGYSFARSGDLVRTAVVHVDAAAGVSVVSGLGDLTVMNATASEFWGYPKDSYTTLPETKDRILATSVHASWRFRRTRSPAASTGVRRSRWPGRRSCPRSPAPTRTRCSRCFSTIGEALISAVPSVCEVRLTLPNKHHYLVDLAPYGLSNEREVYLAGDRPYGLIEGTSWPTMPPAEDALAWS